MSRTGWPIITTPIATLPLLLFTNTTPTVGQLIIYNGTSFVYQASPTVFLSYGMIRITTTGSLGITGGTTVTAPNNTGNITLPIGTYFCRSSGSGTCVTAANGYQLKLVKFPLGAGVLTGVGGMSSETDITNRASVATGIDITVGNITGVISGLVSTKTFSSITIFTVTIAPETVVLSMSAVNTDNYTVNAGTITQFYRIA